MYDRKFEDMDYDTEPRVCFLQDIADLAGVDWIDLSYGRVEYTSRRALDDDEEEDLESSEDDFWLGDIDENDLD